MTDTDDTKRQARREQIAHLLFRAACGVLTADEGAMLRAAVEREFDAAPTPEQAAARGGTLTASDVLMQHDVTRKAMCDAPGAGYHLNWQQIVDAAQRHHDANGEWQAEAEQLRTALATERGAHNEHRRSLAIVHGMSADADWLNVTAAATSVLHARDRDRRFLTEARRLRDEACGLLDKHQLDLAHALGRDRCNDSWGELIGMAERSRQAETEAVRARAAAERERDASSRFAEASGTRAFRADAEARRNRDAWRNARRRAASLGAELTDMRRARDAAVKRANLNGTALVAARAENDGLAECMRNTDRLTTTEATNLRTRADRAEATLTAVRQAVAEAAECRLWERDNRQPCGQDHLERIEAALGDPQPADPCAHGCRQAADEHTRLSQEIDAEPEPAVCCVCGCPDVTYRNYREQPFCCRCAECCDPPKLCAHGCQPPACPAQNTAMPDRVAHCDLPAGHAEDHRDSTVPGILRWTDDVAVYPTAAREQLAEPLLRGTSDVQPIVIRVDVNGVDVVDMIRRMVRRGGIG